MALAIVAFIVVLNFLAFFLVPSILMALDMLLFFTVPLYGMVFYMGFYQSFYVCQFGLASILIRERFKLLNESLGEIYDQRKSKKFKTPTVLQNFSKLYFDLCDSIELVNSSFAVHTIFILFEGLVSYAR